MSRLKHADKLLADIAQALCNMEGAASNARLRNIEVRFRQSGETIREFSLGSALTHISGDLFFDEQGDFSEVDSATIGVM